VIAGVASSSRPSVTPTSTSAAHRAAPYVVSPPATRAGQQVQFGHMKSLKRVGSRFEMRFDPAWWLSGVTAERACGCKPVPNDHVIVDESHRLLTYVVATNARVTVLVSTRRGVTRITVAELAQIVAGKNPRHRPLFERGGPFWIRIGSTYPNPVLALDQQYQP
jgi:hypothetical protein